MTVFPLPMLHWWVLLWRCPPRRQHAKLLVILDNVECAAFYSIQGSTSATSGRSVSEVTCWEFSSRRTHPRFVVSLSCCCCFDHLHSLCFTFHPSRL